MAMEVFSKILKGHLCRFLMYMLIKNLKEIKGRHEKYPNAHSCPLACDGRVNFCPNINDVPYMNVMKNWVFHQTRFP